MAKTKAEKIADIEMQMQQLEKQRKNLLYQQKGQERKDRTKRLCKRMGGVKICCPTPSIPLTEEQFKTFFEKAVANDYSHPTERGNGNTNLHPIRRVQSRQYSVGERRGA